MANAPDRMIFSLFLALALHATVLFGVSFSPTDKDRSHRSTLEIVLVQHRSDTRPQESDFLAQANQEGGGQQPDPARSATPFKAPFVNSDATLALASRPRTEPPSKAKRFRGKEYRDAVVDVPDVAQVMMADEAVRRQLVTEQPPALSEAKAIEQQTEAALPRASTNPIEAIDAESLVSRSLAMASLSAELDQKLEAYAKRPRRKFISAKTREYKYASYMEAWRTKVERIGNLNYPDEARRRKLSGSLRLGVALNPNGTINEIVLRRSSGHKVLDDAAIRIVKLAAPFAPFPEDIRKDTDILHIERTWQFLRSNRLASQ
jgi:protein TonB